MCTSFKISTTNSNDTVEIVAIESTSRPQTKAFFSFFCQTMIITLNPKDLTTFIIHNKSISAIKLVTPALESRHESAKDPLSGLDPLRIQTRFALKPDPLPLQIINHFIVLLLKAPQDHRRLHRALAVLLTSDHRQARRRSYRRIIGYHEAVFNGKPQLRSTLEIKP